MADITSLPVMMPSDAKAIGFAVFNECPHQTIDIPDGGFTITAKTSTGKHITMYFGPIERTGRPSS